MSSGEAAAHVLDVSMIALPLEPAHTMVACGILHSAILSLLPPTESKSMCNT